MMKLGVGGYRVQPLVTRWDKSRARSTRPPDVASATGSQLPTVMTRSAWIGFPVLLPPSPTCPFWKLAYISYLPLDFCPGVCLGYHSLIPSARAVKSNMNWCLQGTQVRPVHKALTGLTMFPGLSLPMVHRTHLLPLCPRVQTLKGMCYPQLPVAK